MFDVSELDLLQVDLLASGESLICSPGEAADRERRSRLAPYEIRRRTFWKSISDPTDDPGAPNENIVQNHLNIALLNVF